MASRTAAPAGVPPEHRDAVHHHAATSPTTPGPRPRCRRHRDHGRQGREDGRRLVSAVAVAVVAAALLELVTAPVLAKHNVFEKPAKVFENPKFHAAIVNVTVPLGREAILACLVDDLGNYKVAWLRVDTQTILTIANLVITKNHRIGVSQTDPRTWNVHIKEVRETDRGWYMCQINTDPMKSQQGYLDVVVPPDILDFPTSTDMVVREGSNVTLRCVANGSPQPTISWRREQPHSRTLPSTREALKAEGQNYSIARVTRDHMGPYVCIASNGVPPSLSKRIMLTVEFPPAIEIPNQLVGARVGRSLTLQCSSQAFPKSHNYWVRGDNSLVQGPGYDTEIVESGYSISMRLIIESLTLADFGEYKCVSKNYLGEAEQSIKVEHVKTRESSWDPVVTKLPKHSKGKQTSRTVNENNIEIPDAEESTSSASLALRVTGNVFLVVSFSLLCLLWRAYASVSPRLLRVN